MTPFSAHLKISGHYLVFFRMVVDGMVGCLRFKSEWMPLNGYDDLAQARVDVASYILGYYSQIRPHSFNNYLTPVEKENQFFNQNLLKTV